jgi:hypothetical protein
MPTLREIIQPARVYSPHHVSGSYESQVCTPEGFTGDTTSNEYMPFFSTFHGMSELVVEGDKRALIYKMQFLAYNPMYSKRARGLNRNFDLVMSAFSSGGIKHLVIGDLGVEVHAGVVLQRVQFLSPRAYSNQEGYKPLLMVGVKPEYLFSGYMSEPEIDVKQFVLFVHACLLGDPIYSPLYKKLYPNIIEPLIQYGIRTVFTDDIKKEFFKVKSYVPEFKSSGALVDYKNSFNNCIDLGDTVNVDYRYPSAIRFETIPENPGTVEGPVEIFPDSQPVSEASTLPGVDGQPFQITLNAEDFRGDFGFVPEERPPLRVSIDSGAVPGPVSVDTHTFTHGQWVDTRAAVPALEIIGLDDEEEIDPDDDDDDDDDELLPEDEVPAQLPF